jgi:hypothetical protein
MSRACGCSSTGKCNRGCGAQCVCKRKYPLPEAVSARQNAEIIGMGVDHQSEAPLAHPPSSEPVLRVPDDFKKVSRAIRHWCVDNCAETRTIVRNCPFNGTDDWLCPLYPYRMGRGRGKKLRAIRKRCLWCCKNSRAEVRLCPSTECPLWFWRFGVRPQTAHARGLFTQKGRTS